jgi:hypothetical protein
MEAAEGVETIYQLAADMGGMGFIENNKAACMLNVLINTHMLVAAQEHGARRFFYASWESLSDDGSIHDFDTTYLWDDAFDKIDALNAASFAGHGDWRLPNLNEMRSLLQFRYPGLDPVFNAGLRAGLHATHLQLRGHSVLDVDPPGSAQRGAAGRLGRLR